MRNAGPLTKSLADPLISDSAALPLMGKLHE